MQAPLSTVDELLDQITALKGRLRLLEGQLAALLDRLSQELEAGRIDPVFSHNDWAFCHHQGRLSTSYSPEARADIRAIQEADMAAGRAVQKAGAPYWTVKAPPL